jgi:hypothetical protein
VGVVDFEAAAVVFGGGGGEKETEAAAFWFCGLEQEPSALFFGESGTAVAYDNVCGAALVADFAMSKIAVNESYGGNMLRKAIDYFCHLAVAPEFMAKIEKKDKAFAESEFFSQMRWLKDVNDDIYDPTYTDMLRIAFTSEFRRGKLQDLVALLSGRNFETKQYEEAVAEESFARLKKGIHAFINKTHFDRLTMILRSAGFITSDLIGGRNAVNFAYILYLRGRDEKMNADDLERLVRRWVAMAVLTGRYAEKPEAAFAQDVCRIDAIGLMAYSTSVTAETLPLAFWTSTLPKALDTSINNSPHFYAYQAAQVLLGDKPFLCQQMTMRRWLLWDKTIGHVYPKLYLKPPNDYRQVANRVNIPIAIDRDIRYMQPNDYFRELADQCNGGETKYGDITDLEVMKANLQMNCLPETLLEGRVPDYKDFLEERRQLMAQKIKRWFEKL